MRWISFQTLQYYLYLLLLVFLPTQFGKHFWPEFAFVNGLRIDYLSPTLFTTDILLVLLFVLFVITLVKFPLTIPLHRKTVLISFFSLLVGLGIFFSKSPLAGVFGVVKLLEFTFFAYYTARVLGKSISYTAAGISLSFALLFESLLGIAQFFAKGSLGGMLYFLGERSFTMETPGIANASINGQLILRPYGTLPHPNVLAAFLLLGILFLVGVWNQVVSKAVRLSLAAVVVIAAIALCFTLSRTVLLVFLFVLIYMAVRRFLKKSFSPRFLVGIFGSFILLCVLLFYTPVLGRFLSSSYLEESFVIREDLTVNAWWMLTTHPFFGVGLENFLQNLPSSSSSSFAYYSLLQPVHNMYLLAFAQLGIGGGILFLYFLFRTFFRLRSAKISMLQQAAWAMCLSVLFLGLFDHYFLTVQQGELLFAFVIGLIFSLPQKTLQNHSRTSAKR